MLTEAMAGNTLEVMEDKRPSKLETLCPGYAIKTSETDSR
jgi:hypothetical protein